MLGLRTSFHRTSCQQEWVLEQVQVREQGPELGLEQERPGRKHHRQRHGSQSQSSQPEESSPTGNTSHPSGGCNHRGWRHRVLGAFDDRHRHEKAQKQNSKQQ